MTLYKNYDYSSFTLFKFFFSGILHKGDGTNIYLKDQPPTIHTMVGTGQRRALDCGTGCSGTTEEATLMAPTALASGPDGSIYVGDFNLVRRITPEQQVFTILELRLVTKCEKQMSFTNKKQENT